MAAQGKSIVIRRMPAPGRAYWLVACIAAALSLAAALFALFAPHSGGTAVPPPSASQQAAARNQRTTFFEGRVASDPFDVTSLNILATEYLQRARETGDLGDYNRADTASGRSAAILPDYFGSVLAAAATRNALHDFAGSLALAAHAVDLRPGQGSAFAIRGDDYVALGRYQEAGSDYQKMLELEPGLFAFSRLAYFSFLKADTLNAEDFWKQAIASVQGLPIENEAYVRVQLGLFYFDRGDLDKADAEVQKALKAYPSYVHGIAARAKIEAARGQFDAAIADYTGVVQRQPLVEYVIALGETYQAAGLAVDAGREFDLVGAIDKLYRANGINTDVALSVFYSNHNLSLSQALRMAQDGYHAAPGIYAADALAWALFKNGRAAEAAPYAEEALRLGTPDASLLYHAGLIQKALGNDARAIDLLDRSQRSNPHVSLVQAPIAAQALSELRAKAGR